MASIATLAVQLTAITTPFTKSMRGATKSITDMQRKASAIDSALLGVAGRFSGIVSAGAIATGAMMKFNQAFEKVEETGDMAAALGASVKNFNALRMATTSAGNDMAKTTSAISKMTKALGDSGAEKAFKQIGLDPAKLRQIDSIGAFEQVARQINKLPTAFDRAKAMSDLFGKSWIDMAEIVGNVNSIEASRAKLDKLGLTITEVDTAMVDAANTAQRSVGAQSSAAFDKLAAKSSPLKWQVFQNISDFTETLPRTFELFSKLPTIGIPARALGYLYDATKDRMHQSVNAIGETSTATDKLTEATNGLAEAQKRQQAIADGFAKAMGKIKAEADRTRNVLDAIKSPGERFGERVNDAFDLLLRKRITMDQYDKYLAKSREELFGRQKEKPAVDLYSQSFAQVTRMGVVGYLQNVARGTQINGMRVSGPNGARVQNVSDPQLQMTNRLLSRIAENTEDNTAVAA